MARLITLNVNEVVVGDRIRQNCEGLEELAASIADVGLINPIHVTENNELIAGERRLRAVRDILGWNTIDAIVCTGTSNDAYTRLRMERDENNQRIDFTFSEKMAIAQIIEERYAKQAATTRGKTGLGVGRTRDRVAEEIDMSPRSYARAKKVWDAGDEEIIKALDAKQLSINAAYTAVTRKLEETEKALAQTEARMRQASQERDEAERRIDELGALVEQAYEQRDAALINGANGKVIGDEELIEKCNKLTADVRHEYERNEAMAKRLAAQENMLTKQAEADELQQAEIARLTDIINRGNIKPVIANVVYTSEGLMNFIGVIISELEKFDLDDDINDAIAGIEDVLRSINITAEVA